MSVFDPTSSDAPWTQRWTLADEVVLSGIGVHTGQTATLKLRPAEAGTGYRFRRVDLSGCPIVPASPALVASDYLATALESGGTRVSTVEHLLAALWGLGISDAWLDLDGPEVPIGDGSAMPFVSAILQVGAIALPAPRPNLALPSAGVMLGERSVAAIPGAGCAITVATDYGRPPLGPMLYACELTPATFATEIAPARTFALEEEVVAMRAAGLIKGGSRDCAVLVGQAGFSVPLRFVDEPIRHKALDLIGDLALLGAFWQGRVVAVKAGHALHVALAQAFGAHAPGAPRVTATKQGVMA